MDLIEVLSIDGLDEAVIGTAIRGSREVLAYDYRKVMSIFLSQGRKAVDVEKYIASVASQEVEGAPIFVYLDKPKSPYANNQESGTTVH
jgi:hypothetical protein